MVDARHHYSIAIKHINLALQSKERLLHDDTLAAILLLAQFETFSADKSTQSNSWGSHIHGALTLLGLRPRQQFESPVGMKLFRHISSSIYVDAIQHRRRLPPQFLDLRAVAAPFQPRSDPLVRLAEIMNDFIDLRATIAERGGTTSASANAWSWIERAQAIEQQECAFLADLPPTWRFKVVTRGAPKTCFSDEHHSSYNNVDHIYHGTYHLYGDPRILQAWNIVRMTRLVLNEIVYKCICAMKGLSRRSNPVSSWDSRPFFDWAGLELESANVVNELASDICYSVPQFVQMPPSGSAATSSQYSPVSTNSDNTTSLAACYFLIWPLYVAASSPVVSASTDDVRRYAIDRLRYMEARMKIPQAGIVAQKLEQGDLREDW
ncbi:hypothetical protein AYO22_07149 [Fonsecaea multimorphosa]|nr:hypothetical protein AYO22_07149 [Fonsecaea multimorphosa]